MPSKKLEFPAGSQEKQVHRTIAVAWITQQRSGFQSNNVVATIHKALRSVGYRTEQHLISRSMVWLAKNGYAAREVVGRRCVEFVMDPNVEVPEPQFVLADRLRRRSQPAPARNIGEAVIAAQEAKARQNGVAIVTTPEPGMPPRRLPPLPGRSADPEPAWLSDVIAALTGWWKAQPETADAWARELLESFQ